MGLTEKYRPHRLEDVVGQECVVAKLSKWLASPTASCFLFKGSGGCGKSALARLVAELLGCQNHRVLCGTDVSTREGAESFVRDLGHSSMFDPWNVFILEEIGLLGPQAREVLKVGLASENLPRRAIVLATSNDIRPLQKEMFEADSGTWLVQRFKCINFSSNGAFSEACSKRLMEIWTLETGLGADRMPHGWRQWGMQNGDGASFSMRVALDMLEMHLSELEVAA